MLLADIRTMISVTSFTFSPIAENTYVLHSADGQAAIIDPGCYTQAERERLAGFVDEHNLEVTMLLQTHCHLDHVFGTKWVAEKWGLLPHMHRNEEQVFKFAPISGQMWGLPFDPYEGDTIWLNEGDSLALGDGELQVLFAPGHAPGHVCFYNAADGYVVGGDVLFAGSIGRTDLPGGNFDVLIESIKTQLLTLPDDTIVYSGHGPATTVGHERKTNPFLQ